MAVNSLAANSPINLQGYNPTFTSSGPGQPPPSEPNGNPTVTISDESRSRQSAQATGELTAEELRTVESFKRRDAEVRAHEQSHAAAAGQYAIGGINLQFRTGPDGQKYAVAGDVRIDTSEVAGDPEATVRKMAAVRRAALAPASPSSQDRRVAARASQLETEARMETLQPPEAGEDTSQTDETEGTVPGEGNQPRSGQAAENAPQESNAEGGIGLAQAPGAFGQDSVKGNDTDFQQETKITGQVPEKGVGIGFRRVSGTGQPPERESGTGFSQMTIRIGNYGQPAPVDSKGSLINISG